MDAINTEQLKALGLPASQASHLELVFSYMSQLSKCSNIYADLYSEGTDPIVLAFMKDVCMLLPTSETSILQSREKIFSNMVATARKQPVSIIENINPAAPEPKPAILYRDGEEDAVIPLLPQHASNLIPDRDQPFTLTSRRAGPKGLDIPYTITFTPTATADDETTPPPKMLHIGSASLNYPITKSKSPHLRRKSVGVEANTLPCVTIVERAIQASPSQTTHRSTSVSQCITASARTVEHGVQTSPSWAVAPLRFTPPSALTTAPSSHTTDLPLPLPPPPKTTTLGKSPQGRNSIPFPSQQRHSTFVQSVDPSRYSVYSLNDPPHRPFNHFSSPLPCGSSKKNGLRRTVAFCHKSHPEIFWNKGEWGERPPDDQPMTYEEALPTWYQEQNASTPIASTSNTRTSRSRSAAQRQAGTSAGPSAAQGMIDRDNIHSTSSSSLSQSQTGSNSTSPTLHQIVSGGRRNRRSNGLPATPSSASDGTSVRRSERFRSLKQAVRSLTGVMTGKRKTTSTEESEDFESFTIPGELPVDRGQAKKRKRVTDDEVEHATPRKTRRQGARK